MFEVPNLDDFTSDPKELRSLGNTFSLLAAYAEHKARAMELRVQGDVEAAISFEKAADHSYNRLPKWAQW